MTFELDEAISWLKAETAAAAAAVANLRGIPIDSALARRRGREVRHVREIARERAELRGTAIAAEVAGAAATIIKAERDRQRRKEAHLKRYGPQCLAIEKDLTSARRSLRLASKASDGVAFGREERELIALSVDEVRRKLDLLEHAVSGTPTGGGELRIIEPADDDGL
jgi:hypothetical protein